SPPFVYARFISSAAAAPAVSHVRRAAVRSDRTRTAEFRRTGNGNVRAEPFALITLTPTRGAVAARALHASHDRRSMPFAANKVQHATETQASRRPGHR